MLLPPVAGRAEAPRVQRRAREFRVHPGSTGHVATFQLGDEGGLVNGGRAIYEAASRMPAPLPRQRGAGERNQRAWRRERQGFSSGAGYGSRGRCHRW